MSTEGGTPDSTPDRTPGRGERRRRPRLAVASVAAAVLLAGGGGAYWASTAAGGGGGEDTSGAPGREGSPPPLALDGYHRGGPAQGIAVGEPDPHGVRYRAEGKLPSGPRSAAVRLPSESVTRDAVAALAGALSVPGAPRLEQGVWRVGGGPGASEPTLQVNGKGPGNWSFAKYGTPGGPGCAQPGADKDRDKGLSEGLGPDPAAASVSCPQYRDGSGAKGSGSGGDVGPVPEEKARSVAAPVLKVLGQQKAKIKADELHGAVRAVVADPVVDGAATYGWQTRLEVGSDGQLVGGGGQLQTPPKGAEYPLISADAALAQLNKSRSGTSADVSVGGCATAVPHGTEGSAPCPGKERPAAEPSVVTGASYALASHYVRGRQALVPSWVFQVRVHKALDAADKSDEGVTVPVVRPAVDPKFLVPANGPSAGPSDPPATGTPKSAPVRVESYSEDGRRLVLRFWGGVCSDYAASAKQSGAAVTVKVTGTEKRPGGHCVLMAKDFTETVTLDEPLGDRKVVDATTGEPVPEKQRK
ncbi:hypothetical protein [Streptomyces albireticuli]|uniref:Large membrane protein n=1 Tax=Streptomyces albireticuli TaxID=1940 RepID=A0A2A2DFR4_9ACTN|nr:hypothetical protein [Streptomyces albireticuli]MCD9142083.1 hypothetical protein [Streptomyces albireticuli]MCD9162663.1 hypothetical protein [Streptomyces albireticuli]MCD9190257.1 hypothetical protein [Streptomyces albireticuli]PAU50170.1 hypothetical protein CK936_04000 [Streptomyces albireticuli]